MAGVLYVVAALLGCLFLKWYLKRRAFHAKLKKLPGPKPTLLFGNMKWAMRLSRSKNLIQPFGVVMLEAMMGQNRLFEKSGFYVFWLCNEPVLSIFTPDLVEVILNSNTSLQKSFEYSFLHSWLGFGLLTGTGSKWRSRRKLLTPSFHFRILEDFLPVFCEQSMVFVKKIKATPEKREAVDIVPHIVLLTLDIVCETVMGARINAQEGRNSEYVTAIHTLGVVFHKRLVSPWLWPEFIFQSSRDGASYKKDLHIVHSFTRQVIKDKKKSLIEKGKSETEIDEEVERKRRKALMDLLLELHLDGEQMKEEDIQEEVDTFMFEGHDTTALGITYALYCIGLYPEVQQKIVEELGTIFGNDVDRPVTMDDVREMKYLECAIKESQRLYPSVPLIGRELEEDINYDGYILPKGLTVHINIITLHRSPEYFPNPEVFDPDRFAPENALGRHPFAFVPFSAGPRNCIGQKFALLEEKVVISTILRHFRIASVDPRDKVQVCFEFTLKPGSAFKLQFFPRT